MRVLVCGGRKYANRDFLFRMLDMHNAKRGIACIVHGGATGADTLAGEWAASVRVPCEVYHAEWLRHGKRAGPIRNARMITEGKPDLVLAFLGGRGTADMIAQARHAGVEVLEPMEYGETR